MQVPDLDDDMERVGGGGGASGVRSVSGAVGDRGKGDVYERIRGQRRRIARPEAASQPLDDETPMIEALFIKFVTDEFVILGPMPENQASYTALKHSVNALHALY